MEITDTSVAITSPYAKHARQGAVMVPRVLFFVNEVENPTTTHVGGTVTTVPRRGRLDKEPWKSLDLQSLHNRTVEADHVFNAHLGETVVPYAALNALKVILPISSNAGEVEKDDSISHGVQPSSLMRNMQRRWRDVDAIWDENKSSSNSLKLLDQLDYYGKLSSQTDWHADKGNRPIRVVYAASGTPTAAVVHEDNSIVDYTLFWLTCRTMDEAYYLTTVINSDELYEQLKPLMPKGQFGARHVQKHLWRLPIPEFDASDADHVAVSEAGRDAAAGVERELGNLRQRYPQRLTVTIARREIRKWLRESSEGKRVEEVVGVLLA